MSNVGTLAMATAPRISRSVSWPGIGEGTAGAGLLSMDGTPAGNGPRRRPRSRSTYGLTIGNILASAAKAVNGEVDRWRGLAARVAGPALSGPRSGASRRSRGSLLG